MVLPSKIPELSASPANDQSPTLDDLRFRALLSSKDWERLPLATRQRFSKRLAGGETTVYVGVIDKAESGLIGWCIAQIARAIGGPLPVGMETQVPIIVTVTEDTATGGQIWTRVCARRNGFPQVIHSSKRFSGPTGLEEYVGYGICMALQIFVDGQSLLFRSAGYFLQVGHRRLRLPAFVTPGELTVGHTDLGNGEFRFTLEVVHPRFGKLISQSALFREATP